MPESVAARSCGRSARTQAGEEIEAPDAVWAAREVMDVSRLPASWNSILAGSASVRAGGNWLSWAKTAILQVPSVLVPEESAAFINPLHPQATGLRAEIFRRFD